MSGNAGELEGQLAAMEVAISAGNADAAKLALRHYLFGTAGVQVEGSAADAIAAVALAPAGRGLAAVVTLRALAADLVGEGRGEQLARYVVGLAEAALPQLCEFIGLEQRAQNHEKLAKLRGAHDAIMALLQPLRTPYASLETLVGAKNRLTAALQHSMVRTYGRPYHVDEVAELVSRLLATLGRVLRMDEGFEADLKSARQEMVEGRDLVESRPSFLTTENLRLLLDNASRALEAYLVAMQGRFVSEIARADRDGIELQKRYPLHEEGRDLRVVVPFRNEGPGPALDVAYRVSCSAGGIVDAEEQVLGDVAPGEFGLVVDVLVERPCKALDLELHVGWREVGAAMPREELFGARILAQRSDVDWAKRKYWNPYSTEPAEGADFYGRQEQLRTLVARFLQRPMEPSYITGQKRVGKTSLAKAAAQEAKAESDGTLTTGYILWGRVAHEDPRQAMRQFGEAIERIVVGGLGGERPPAGDYDGSLAPLLDLLDLAREREPSRRFAVIVDEFDEMPEQLWVQGGLAETLFGNLRALTTASNFCLLLVGGENMPFVMERQGARLNKFNRLNLTYFSRTEEWDDFTRLVRGPTDSVLTWHRDAISTVFNITNGNPYFTNIICKQVASRAVTERDGDITAREVEHAVTEGVAALDVNAFMHLWQDGILGPVEEREAVILKRRRALAALARCLRAGRPSTLSGIMAHRGATPIDERELAPVLHNLADRGVLVEGEHGYDVALPIFRLWLLEVGLSRLANDGLSAELAAVEQRIDDEAFVRAAETVALAGKWKPYRGRPIGSDDIRHWIEQRAGNRDQRALFEILKAVRVVGRDEVLARLRQAGQVIRDVLGVPTRRSNAERRRDVVLTYVDGEGKSGQRHAGDYAEANNIEVEGIIAPAAFEEGFRAFSARHGVPKALVIVDDIVATGGTLSAKVADFTGRHRTLLEESGVRVEICALFATEAGSKKVLETLTSLSYPQVDFRAGEVLSVTAFAFAASPGVFPTAEVFDRAKSIAVDVGTTIYRRAPLGVGDQGLLLVLPDTVPNNSLPMLHSASKDKERPWRPLFERIVNG